MATFGNANMILGTPGGSYGVLDTNDAAGCLFTTPADCTAITDIRFYCQGGPTNCKGVVWTTGGVFVGATNANAAPASAALTTFTFGSALSVSANTQYYFGLISGGNGTWGYYEAGSANQTAVDNAGTGAENSYASPTTLEKDSELAWSVSLYMTYTAGGGATTLTVGTSSYSISGAESNLLHGGHGWLRYRKP
jgi:hypothetical protein